MRVVHVETIGNSSHLKISGVFLHDVGKICGIRFVGSVHLPQIFLDLFLWVFVIYKYSLFPPLEDLLLLHETVGSCSMVDILSV